MSASLLSRLTDRMRRLPVEGLNSPVASALRAISDLAIWQPPEPVAQQSGEEAVEDSPVRQYTMLEADGWIRTGPPDFDVVRHSNGNPKIIPRHTRLEVSDVSGDYSFVEDEEGDYAVWTSSANLSYYYRENEPMRSVGLAPEQALSTNQDSANKRAAARLYNRVGGLVRSCASELIRQKERDINAGNLNHVTAFILSVFVKEFSGAPHTPGRAGIRIEPHLIRDNVLESQEARDTFKKHFFKQGNSWRFSEEGDANSVPLYPASSGGSPGEFFQDRQYLAMDVARNVLEEHDLEPDLVLQGISIGGPQILMSAIHYDLYCGYSSPQAMWDAFQGPDERPHVLGCFDFIRHKKHHDSRRFLSHYMLEKDFSGFGVGYNGSSVYGPELKDIHDEVMALFR